MKKTSIILTAAAIICSCSTPAPEPFGALPSTAQVEWQKMETNMFIHFGPNTFTNVEWGDGNESVDDFNPTEMDCRQWASIAKEAGFKGIIITAKHHDGFCIWPNPQSTHTVAQSKWRDGKGDVLKDLSDACREYGLKFGIYISPWDQNDPHYGTPEYNEVFRKTIEHAHTNYGEVFEQWFDGACGEGPNGKRQVYDWDMFNGEVFKHHPNALIFSDVGPGCRWIGNERGICRATCWSTMTTEGFGPGRDAPAKPILNGGEIGGKDWVPGESDVSIRPGWFWRESENDKVKSLHHLLYIYYSSVGHNSLLLLNVPPDTRGLIHECDAARLREFRQALDEIFDEDLAKGATIKASETRGRKFRAENLLDDDYDSYWTAGDDARQASITLEFAEPKTFNRVQLQEYIPLGQRVAEFNVEIADENGNWQKIADATTIGYKRIVLTDMVTTNAVRINITDALAVPVLNGISIYKDDIYTGYGNMDSDSKIIWHEMHKPMEWDADIVREVKGFRYTPDSGQNCITRYRLEKSMDWENWTVVYDNKRFDNIVNNPVTQEVIFEKPIKAMALRIVPVECESPEGYAFKEFEGIL